jgi:glycosyltransferase involved in cell wall biosynthesis
MNNNPNIPVTEVSVILPAYNEAKRIRDTVAVTAETLKEITPSFEIIIAEDGSTDGTADIASELSRTHEYVKHLHSDARQGRGRALNRAFKFASGDIICYIDVDLATDMEHLRELIDAIRYEGYDISTGSRMMPKSVVNLRARYYARNYMTTSAGLKVSSVNRFLSCWTLLKTNIGSGIRNFLCAPSM